LELQKTHLNVPQKVSPETLQTFGMMAIGLGFVLIGLGGFSTYHASQKLQHAAELREVEQKWEMTSQIQTLLLKNQQLQQKTEERPPAPPQAPTAPPPAAYYYRPPSPPPPPTRTESEPAPREPAQAEAPSPALPPEPASAPAEPATQVPQITLDPMESRHRSDWEEPESLRPDTPGEFLTTHQQHVIADTLRAHGRHTVTIESSYGDRVSRAFAGELAAAFAEADWLVRGIDAHRGLPLASGVTVSAGSFPPQQETRAVYEALLSAGIPVTQQLNPKQHNSETVVLVGAPL
jgi:type IV secretory pathway VirB10-like protein